MKKFLRLALFLSFLFGECVFAASQLKTLTIALDWFVNPDHAPIIIAKEQGFFKEQGLNVELIGPSDPSEPPKWVAAKKVDLGITYEPEFMQQVDQGLPLIRVGTLIDKPLDCVVALAESGIKNIADLKGKKIGTGSNGMNGMMIRSLLEKNGLKASDVELINIRYNLTSALLTKRVDAVTGMMRNFEIPQLESAGHKVTAFFPEEHHIPNYSVLIFIAHLDMMKDPRIPKFLFALKKAVAYLDTHPQQTWQQFANRYPEANNAVNREAWFATMPYFAEDPSEFDKHEWHDFAEFMFNNQLIRKIAPITRYAVVLR